MKVPLGYSIESYEPTILNVNEVKQNNNYLRQVFTGQKTPQSNYYGLNYQNTPIYNSNILRPNNNLVYTNIINNSSLSNKYINNSYITNKSIQIPMNYTTTNLKVNNTLKNNNSYILYQPKNYYNNNLITPRIKNNLFMPLVSPFPYQTINNDPQPKHRHHEKSLIKKSKSSYYSRNQLLYLQNMPIYKKIIYK